MGKTGVSISRSNLQKNSFSLQTSTEHSFLSDLVFRSLCNSDQADLASDLNLQIVSAACCFLAERIPPLVIKLLLLLYM